MKQLYHLMFGCAMLPFVLAAADKVAVTDTAAVAPAMAIVPDTAMPSLDTTIVLHSETADTVVSASAPATTRDSVHLLSPGKPGMSAAPTSAERTSTRKIKLVKREYNYRQQVGLAVGMMAFIAIIMTTAQSMNPQ